MSLYKQLWLAVVLLLTVVFCISFAVTTLSARAYLEQQLSIKNADNAGALALSLSQQGADDVLLELTVSAQFDTGYYELIELVDPQGKSTIRRIDSGETNGAPNWFVRLFPIKAKPGVANIQAGWQQAGTLTLRSHSRFAYEELWRSTLTLAGVFLLAGTIAGFFGNRLLKGILRPLDDVVKQAESLKQRRFITIAEPRTRELKQVVSSMNALSNHIKSMLGQEAKRLQKWQQEAHVDKVTGLSNREPFLKQLDALLAGDDASAAGSIVLVRITDLTRLNQVYGRNPTDGLLRDIGNALNKAIMQSGGWLACRLNGSDFAVLSPRELDAGEIGGQIQGIIGDVLENHGLSDECLIPGAATAYHQRDRQSELLTRLDGALVSAQHEHKSSMTVAHRGDIPVKPVREQLLEWRIILEDSLGKQCFALAQFPVLDLEDKLIHFEAPVTLDWQGETQRAGRFLPWVNRLQLALELDKQVVKLALEAIEREGQQLAINLSAAALTEDSFTGWLEQALTSHHGAAQKLWLEIPESIAFRHFANFKRLCSRAKLRGARLGIEHVGHQLAELGQLHDVGLDYLKVDASFVRNIQDNPGNQTLLGALITLGHSIGLQVIAEGVNSAPEWQTLHDLGVDGATGPAIRLPA